MHSEMLGASRLSLDATHSSTQAEFFAKSIQTFGMLIRVSRASPIEKHSHAGITLCALDFTKRAEAACRLRRVYQIVGPKANLVALLRHLGSGVLAVGVEAACTGCIGQEQATAVQAQPVN